MLKEWLRKRVRWVDTVSGGKLERRVEQHVWPKAQRCEHQWRTLTTGRHSTSTIAWRFTTCTHTNSTTERAHVVLFLAHFIHTHMWLKNESCPLHLHSHPSSWPSTWTFSLHVDPLHSLPLSVLPVLLPFHLLPQRRAAAGAQPEVHQKPAQIRQRVWGRLRRPLLHHTELEWNIFPGFNTLQLSEEVQSLLYRNSFGTQSHWSFNTRQC